ncbi:hypothetical protein B0H13DRAFT_1891258 [Mycena leptocephala]|nr:hypothetical protein B0H13DRAFT_1891258 [Mycena leptocephala]
MKMPMQLRLTTRVTVPPPPSSDSPEGSVELDAPMGTSTGNNENDDDMGHSAKTHSGSQDDADETGHRSGGIDHSRSNADAASYSVASQEGADVSGLNANSGPTLVASSQDGSAMSGAALEANSVLHPVAASQDGSAMSEATFHDASSELRGFAFPKKSSRASSVRSASPVLHTSPRFFQDWFESTEADGPGEIPADWIKKESVSIDLAWTPPVENDIDLSFGNLMRESLRTSPPRTSTPRIPAAAKGKGRDFATAPSIDYNDGYVSEEEAADDAARLYQLQADALLAMKLQNQWNSQEEPQATNGPPVPGPSNVNKNPFVAPVPDQVSLDHEVAASLQKMFDEQFERMREMNSRPNANTDAHDDNLQRRREEAGRRNRAPNARPPPMDQIPKSSILFREARGTNDSAEDRPKKAKKSKPNASPPPSDSSSSSSSDSNTNLPSYLNKPRKSKKKSKKSKKGKNTRRSKGNASPPSDDSSSNSESSSSSSSDSNDSESDWSSLGSAPSEANSDDSKRTKRSKKRAKKNWNMKLLRLRLEQSNAKPDPPFVYNGEPNFGTMERWTYEARQWTTESYIRPNMKVDVH